MAAGLTGPVNVAAPRGDAQRLFIVEVNTGRIKILKSGTLLPVPFLDIGALLTVNQSHGLLGLAFHPNYASNGFFYVQYVDSAIRPTVARYQVSGDPDVANAASGQIVIRLLPIVDHQGGGLAFGPNDGYLYAAFGDAKSEDPDNNAQNDGGLRGKLVRLDVDSATPYAIPPTNPFVGPGNPRDEIWAKGFRNPFRLSFDRETGDLWVGDVGQGNREEVDFQPAASSGGENYGWRPMEGSLCFNPPTGCNPGGLTLPIFEYGHLPLACSGSVTGGVVYRGSAMPSLRGTYFFADFCWGRSWSFRYDGSTLTEFVERTSELAPRGGLSIDNPTAIGEDGLGEMYITDFDGEVYKIVNSLHANTRKP
ncbi:MAG: glucose dehydrogenase [Planctomycetes bacterium]|nr:glucose dehydrogenase [Planctomycetota bacterium]